MTIIPWSDDLKTGIKSIDEEHQILIGLASDLYEAITNGHGQDAIQKTMQGLVLYISTHFEHEEEFMFTTNYPYYKEHIKEHEDLRTQVMRLELGIHKGCNENLANEIFTFLKSWIRGHVRYCDNKYVTHLQAHGIK